MRRTARAAIHRTNAVRRSSPRIAPGPEVERRAPPATGSALGRHPPSAQGRDTGIKGNTGCSSSAARAGRMPLTPSQASSTAAGMMGLRTDNLTARKTLP